MFRCAEFCDVTGNEGGFEAWPFQDRGMVVPSAVYACASKHQCLSD